MRQKTTNPTGKKDSTPGGTDIPPTQVITTLNQKKVLAAVKIFFGGIPASDYIHHLTWLQSDWLMALAEEEKLKGLYFNEIRHIADITYRIGKVMTLISKLDEIIDFDIDDIIKGGSLSREELLEGLL